MRERERELMYEPKSEHGGQVVNIGERHRLFVDATPDRFGRPGLQLSVVRWCDDGWQPVTRTWIPRNALCRVLLAIGDVAAEATGEKR